MGKKIISGVKEMTNSAWEVSLSLIVGPRATAAQGRRHSPRVSKHSAVDGLQFCAGYDLLLRESERG